MSAQIHISTRVRLSGRELMCLNATLSAYVSAVDYAVSAGKEIETTGNARLHHLCYRDIRDKHRLSANLTIRAIARAAAILKEEGRRDDRIDFDARVCRLSADAATVSISSLCGRIAIPLPLTFEQKALLLRSHFLRATAEPIADGVYEFRFTMSPLVERRGVNEFEEAE
jgi:putative transposase